MIERVWNEFKTTPIQFLVAVITLLTLIIGVLSSIHFSDDAITQAHDIQQKGVLYSLAVSIAVTFILAIVIKFIPAGVPTIMGSIVIASINVFLVIYIIDINLKGGLSGKQLNSARDLAFYGVMFFYCVFNFKFNEKVTSSDEKGTTVGELLIMLCIWGLLVSKGESYITGAFKPALKEVKERVQAVDAHENK